MEQYDVCIVGAGAAGIFAADAFKNSKSRVCIIEKKSEIGGTFYHSWVNNWIPEMNISDLLKKANSMSDDYYKKTWIHSKFSKNGGEESITFSYNNAEFIEYFNKRKTEREEYFLSSECVKANCENGKINSITVKKIDGTEFDVSAKFFIDATGDAVLSRLAGFHVHIGADEKSIYGESLAPESAADKESYLNWPSLMYVLTKNKDEAEDLTDIQIPNEKDAPKYIHDGYISEDKTSGKFIVNPLSGLGITGKEVISNYDTAYKMAVEKRKVHWKYVQEQLRKKKKAGESGHWYGWNIDFFDYYLSKEYAPALGVRETYRVKCYRMLHQNDLEKKISSEAIQKNHFIACGNHGIDIHGADIPGRIEFNTNKLQPYGVPLECFIPCDSNNLFVAGRCAGYSHIASSSFRINKSAAQSGWSVGNAVRLLLDKNVLKSPLENGRFDEKLFTILVSDEYTRFSTNVKYMEENILK